MKPGHEVRDIRPRPIVLVGMAVIGLLTVVSVGLFGLARYYAGRLSLASAPNPLAATYGLRQPPEPRLQTDPRLDLEALRAAEEHQLQGYGWINRETGRVRIPIDRAMALLVERRGNP